MTDYSQIAGGGFAVVFLITLIGVIRKNSGTERKLDSKVGHAHCKDQHDKQNKVNTDLIKQVAVVEVKLDIGFKNLEAKIGAIGRR